MGLSPGFAVETRCSPNKPGDCTILFVKPCGMHRRGGRLRGWVQQWPIIPKSHLLSFKLRKSENLNLAACPPNLPLLFFFPSLSNCFLLHI